MLTSDDAGLLVRWDTKTWATRSYRRHTDTICAIAVSPDDNWIATASGDTTVRLWHARTMDSLALPHAQKARDVKFLPDGRLASCSLDGTVRIWDAPHAWASREPDANLAAFLSSMTAAEVDFGHRVSNPGPFSSRLNEERTPQ